MPFRTPTLLKSTDLQWGQRFVNTVYRRFLPDPTVDPGVLANVTRTATRRSSPRYASLCRSGVAPRGHACWLRRRDPR
jgi:hypothetical protein